MIKILDHTKSLASLVNDNTNGLGRLDAIECIVTEELNGIYEAQIVILQSDKHFNDLQVGGLLKISAGEVVGEQIFRIYFISKPIDEKIVLRCAHISYDLNKIPVKPFNSTGAVQTKNRLLSNVIGTYPFNMMTDITNNTTYFSLDTPKSFRECLGGWEGSILDKFRCEYEWDNLLVKMLAHRGSDEGVRIAYGKNLTDFKQDENIENVYTSVLGYAVVNEQTYVGDVYHKIVSNMPKVLIVDFSQDFDGTTPTTAQLTQKAQDYATNNDIEIPNVSINVAFVPLYQTEEYKNIAPLERVGLGDTVHVYFDKLGVEATSRVVKTVWNVLLDRYDSIELGNTKANLTTLLDDAVQEAKENITIDAGFIETEMNEMSQLIINGLGLHRTLVPLSTGGHRMYLHNKPTLAESDTQYVISSGGFMVSTDYGQTWNSGWDSSGNVVVNALSTIVLKALEIYGSYLCFGDYPNGKYIEATTYSNSSSVQQGVSFDGTGTIRMQPKDTFLINNLSPDGSKYYNRLVMNKGGSSQSNLLNLINYDDRYDYILANQIMLNAHRVTSNSTTGVVTTNNRIYLDNYRTHQGTSYAANNLSLNANVTSQGRNTNSVVMTNYQVRLTSETTTRTANTFNLTSQHDGTRTIQNVISLNSYKPTQNIFANRMDLSAPNNNYTIGFYNYNSNADSIGNQQVFNSRSASNTIKILNNVYGTTNAGNEISMSSASSQSDTTINNRDGQNKIVLTYSNSGTKYNQITMSNSVLNSTGMNNKISLYCDSSTANVEIVNYNSSNVMQNQIIMSNNSRGADINIQSIDDVIISGGDRMQITGNRMILNYATLSMNGRTLIFDSSGYVKWS